MDNEGRIVFIVVVYMGYREIVEYLLDYGVEVNYEDVDGRIVFFVVVFCVFVSKGYVLVVSFLID